MAKQSPSTFTNFPATSYPDVPIDPRKEIRLVTIKPGKGNQDIECTLSTQTLDLDDAGELAAVTFEKMEPLPYKDSILDKWRPAPEREYFALSYCWGGFEDHKTIKLNNLAYFPVSHNLWCALRRLRNKIKKSESPRRYWIDQICMNQHDISERNQQVSIMAQIFHQAFRVIIWLFDTPEEQAPSVFFTRSRRMKMLLRTMASDQEDKLWWNRAWVTQEFLLARYPPIAMYGPCEVEWRDLLPGPDDRLWHQSYDTSLSHAQSRFFDQGIGLRVYGQLDLDEFFETILVTKCFDPRDKIYSLLGLIKGLAENIRPDYTKDPSQFLTEVTQAAIQCSGFLDALSMVAMSDPARKELELPSWVINFAYSPDWNSIQVPKSSAYRGESKTRTTSPWCQKNSIATAQVSFCSFASRPALSIKGVEFDEVFRVFPLEGYSRLPRKTAWPETVGDLARQTLSEDDEDRQLERGYHPDQWKFLSPLFDLGDPYERLGHGDSSEMLTNGSGDEKYKDIRERIDASKVKLGVYDIVHLIRLWREKFSPEANPKRWKWIRQSISDWEKRYDLLSNGCSLFATCSGFIGIGPSHIQKGDEIALPYGSTYPFLLERLINGAYAFKGVVFVEGIMYGKLHDHDPPVELRENEWTLV